jgi:hypothetical protein
MFQVFHRRLGASPPSLRGVFRQALLPPLLELHIHHLVRFTFSHNPLRRKHIVRCDEEGVDERGLLLVVLAISSSFAVFFGAFYRDMEPASLHLSPHQHILT